MNSKVKTYISDNVLEKFYEAVASGDSITLERVHIPLSDVFYVRKHLEAKFSKKFSLDYVERCMYLEGYLPSSDVYKPNTKRDWED